jgi:DNA-binding transcriptional regulator YhcF (GntR family)
MKTSSQSEPFAFRLDAHSGVPVFRQIIDQVQTGIAAGALRFGDQLPTVRQTSVDLAINPNTVLRAYREMEIRGIVDTQQGTGTFIAAQKLDQPKAERERALAQLVGELVSRAGASGFTLQEVMDALRAVQSEAGRKRR